MFSKKVITRQIAELENVGYNEIWNLIWHDKRDNDSLLLTSFGIKCFRKLEFDEFIYDLSGMTPSMRSRQVFSKQMQGPYYFTKSEVIVFYQDDATLLALFKDKYQEFVETYSNE